MMKRKKLLIAGIIGATSFLMACKKTEVNTNTENCNVIQPTYEQNIQSLISTNCSSCHADNYASKGSGVRLDNYADLKIYASSALECIKHTDKYPQMPKGGNKLSDCDINMFKNWVDQGMIYNMTIEQ